MDRNALARITSDDPTKVMPFGEARFSDRAPDDPIVAYAKLLQEWLDAGSPDFFYPQMPATSAQKAFTLSETVGKGLTNIGNCVPDRLASGAHAKNLDDIFAKATELPKLLEQTDLTSLDSELLAREGVVAFAPAYPLWADDAKKIRHVRVPVGTSISYNSETKDFDIPLNTRFYKTFLKKVIDIKGNVAYRKIETRLIVSRPDVKKADGTTETLALYGTYKWQNDDESVATLQEAKLNDGSLFADELTAYDTDEVNAAKVRAADPTHATAELVKQGLRRHYAIPGKARCDQCHEGSPSASFILGFTPLQIARRPLGEGGTIEAAGEDELTQLQRLIDYGVITGMPASTPKLEESQGSRKPRNKYELEAQGYLLGNCSHCHNPRGFPSTNFPELASVLNFWPDTETGGVFQFPLDRMSPRTKRFATISSQPVAKDMPYITPSLTDMSLEGIPSKFIYSGLAGGSKPPRSVPYVKPTGMVTPNNEQEPVDAPWRSLIYRNVDTPFTYVESKAIFTHMPLHTSGFDCRVPKIVGNWMVSIPARLSGTAKYIGIGGALDGKTFNVESQLATCSTALHWVPDDKKAEKTIADCTADEIAKSLCVAVPANPGSLLSSYPFPAGQNLCQFCVGNWCFDPEIKFPSFSEAVQPYKELSMTSAGLFAYDPFTQTFGGSYAAAVAEAEERLKIYQAGERYNYCPDTTDIVDPEVGTKDTQGKTIVVPREKPPEPIQQLPLGVPSRPHFIITDVTEAPGEYKPRRPDFAKILRADPFASPLPSDLADASSDVLAVLQALKSVRITPEFRALATTPLPYGLWEEKPSCDFSSTKTVSQIRQGTDVLAWTKASAIPAAPPEARVYEQSPGGSVFQMICSNCHGQLADSKGKLSDRILDLTGGQTRVANLRDGLLGPAGRAGDNRNAVFATDAQAMGISTDDLAGRYVAWMGLGGTLVDLPPPILQLVGATPVFGRQRNSRFSLPEGTPNMLQVALELCKQVLPLGGSPPKFDAARSGFITLSGWPLFDDNGDADFWQRICSADNLPPIRVLRLKYVAANTSSGAFLQFQDLRDRTAYPSNTPVGTEFGTVENTLSAGNRLPWCIELQSLPGAGTDPTPQQIDAYAVERALAGAKLPICPQQLFSNVEVMGTSVPSLWTDERSTTWARRGAINAGLSVFLYLDGVARGTIIPKPAFNQCENLSKQ